MLRRQFLSNALVLLAGVSSSGLVRALSGAGPATANGSLSGHHKAICNELCEMFIPRTDTPGAVDAGVPDFIDEIVSRWYSKREREIFLGGLEELDRRAREEHDVVFLESSAAQRSALLSAFEADASKYVPERKAGLTAADIVGKGTIDEETPFFSKLKELVVLGYYTSEAASSTETVYIPVPGRYSGDALLSESNGRQYTW